ncbi:3-deoxy-manno-octulosonate cytidylyltransferase [Syntrophorhabdus aromaticivorans]|uniref:3-deoxy-manno-octulosonate cytidylyltransferase n=1 Tax=Syntrophorhabdus aromaticivorans TaxID=328301 RepID=UPI0003F7B158|nr:3-deoxy-manno-octulosonate cytidylyltransferase [Syntrophorhabdus aromaticivorans]
MKKLIVIPARYGSTRLPGKPLLDIGGKPLLWWVFEKARQSRLKDGVLIATDDERISDAATAFGADVVMTSPTCASGTDRVFEAVKGRGAGLVVNLQGDEPFIEPSMIDDLFTVMENEKVDMATLCCPVADEREYADPNTVKVVLDRSGFALYFSRSPIPFQRTAKTVTICKHVGIYGYTGSFLERFVIMPRSILEETESLEQLRVLENGYRIRVVPTTYNGFGIDTEEDLLRAAQRLAVRT